MTFSTYTLGCKANQYETQAMEQLLIAAGHRIVPFGADCDGCIINTCSVTAVADKKNRGVIRRCRREHPQAVIAVCGCYSQHAAQEVRELGADLVGGSGQRREFVQLLITAAQDRRQRTAVDQALRRREFEPLPAGGLEERTRALLKVQDGCVNFCTYCIIPYTRGPVRSASLEWAVEQARSLERRGYREIVLTGIEIASWGVDLAGKPGLARLTAAICQAVPQVRIRLGSLEPRIVTPEFCAELTQFSNLCPQFHLSLQSGSDSVLARMHRKYDTARYYESVELLRRHFPGCAITTDLIVGFPGESREEFQQSLDFMVKCRFADMHIFPYSRRPGTPADQMPGQLSRQLKEERSRQAIALGQQLSLEYRQALVGQVLSVLFEGPEGELQAGHAPNYVKVYAAAGPLHNEIRPVRVEKVFNDGVFGTLAGP